jgi:hypothetical protein
MRIEIPVQGSLLDELSEQFFNEGALGCGAFLFGGIIIWSI